MDVDVCRRRLELENRVENESEKIEKRKREKAEVRLMRKRAAQQFSVDRLKMKEQAMRELGTHHLLFFSTTVDYPACQEQPC